MAKAEPASDARVLVGVDISRNRHEVLIAVPGKLRRRRIAILNKAEGFQRLIDVVQEFGLVGSVSLRGVRRRFGAVEVMKGVDMTEAERELMSSSAPRAVGRRRRSG